MELMRKAASGKAANPPEAGNKEPADLYETRLEKLRNIQNSYYDPYQQYFSPKNHTSEVLALPVTSFSSESSYSLAGRIRSKRMMGKAAFCDLEDHSGRIQIYINRDSLGKESFQLCRMLDLGDIIGLEGYVFQTRTQETSIFVRKLLLLAKCLRPLPVVKEAQGQVFDAFADQEQRYRRRYVDLIVNPAVRQSFVQRSQMLRLIRDFLADRSYIEVETPAMQPIPGGATARPFITHHNTLDMKLYLRVAPELYLKRLIVGGFPRVFEIGRNFRNEGISPRHNPEFSMLELYEAYGNLESMYAICEELICYVVNQIHGTLTIEYGPHKINFQSPWKRMTYLEAIEEYTGIRLSVQTSLKEAQMAAKSLSLPSEDYEACKSHWQIAEVIFDKKVEAKLIEPTFIHSYPQAISPLAKSCEDEKELVQRFEPYIAGREIGNAFSELNDPIEQKKRFEQQLAEHIHPEEAYMDHDYVRALEYAMPPTGGLGIGIDRLAMLLSNRQSIRDTILFPLLRPEHSANKKT